jgi:HNH endonuclease
LVGSGESRRYGNPTDRILNPYLASHGYRVAHLQVVPVRIRRYVHEIVAAAFIGPRPEGYHINHIDAVRSNNRVENLEYSTQYDNIHHAIALGRQPHARLCPAIVEEIRASYAATGSYLPMKAKYNLDDTHVWRIVTRRAWKHVA